MVYKIFWGTVYLLGVILLSIVFFILLLVFPFIEGFYTIRGQHAEDMPLGFLKPMLYLCVKLEQIQEKINEIGQ